MVNITSLNVTEAMNKDYGAVNHNTSVHVVLDLMLENQWSELLVVDDAEREQGFITREHLTKKVSEGISLDMPIREVCLKEIITINDNVDLTSARDLMRWHKIGRLPVVGNDGNIVGILTARDVCNGFSGKLEALGNHMFSVIENIAEAVQVIDCEGKVTLWNQQAEKIFGIKTKEIVGRNINEFFPNDILIEVINTQESYKSIPAELDDGTFVVRNAVPVFLPDGGIIGAVCTTQDVSRHHALLDELEKANNQVRDLKKVQSLYETNKNEGFYTVDAKTQLVLAQAKKVAKTNATVLIQGESGTGKELMARVIYENSNRAKGQFIEVNCSAIPETLFESEMFGYEAGAFTGAQKYGKIGKFELAQGGTIFLDEIGELPLDMQAKLLRVLQEKRFYRVGGTKPIDCDVRIVAATNQKLYELVQEGKFRDDLYYRLNVVNLLIPPLRERVDDIPGLTVHFLKQLTFSYNRTIDGIDEEFIKILNNYSWPGNVRQLHNLLERLVILTDGQIINRQSLEEIGVLDLLLSDTVKETPQLDQSTPIVKEDVAIQACLEDIVLQKEREVIIQALEECRNNKAQTAKLLGIPRSTLYYKLRSLEITC